MYLPRIGVSFQKPLRDVMLFDCNKFFFVAKNKGGCYSFFCALFFLSAPLNISVFSQRGISSILSKGVNIFTWFYSHVFLK